MHSRGAPQPRAPTYGFSPQVHLTVKLSFLNPSFRLRRHTHTNTHTYTHRRQTPSHRRRAPGLLARSCEPTHKCSGKRCSTDTTGRESAAELVMGPPIRGGCLSAVQPQRQTHEGHPTVGKAQQDEASAGYLGNSEIRNTAAHLRLISVLRLGFRVWGIDFRVWGPEQLSPARDRSLPRQLGPLCVVLSIRCLRGF